MNTTKATSIRMPLDLSSQIKALATHYERTENEQMVWMLKQQVRLEQAALREGKKAMQWNSDEQAYFGTTSDGRDIRVEGVEYAESWQDGGDDELLNDPDAWASLAGDNQNVTIVK